MQRSVRFFLLITFFSLAVGCGESVSPEERIAAARAYLANDDARSALIELKNALQDDPNNAEARLLSGRVHLSMGDGGSAEKEFRNAIAMGESPGAIQPLIAQALFLGGEYDELLELDPEEPWLTQEGKATIRGMRGMAYVAKDDAEKARRELEAGAAIDPANPDILVGLGWLNSIEGDFKAGRNFAQQALERDDSNAEAWSLLGNIERHEGDLEASRSAFDRALQLRPTHLRDSLDRIAVQFALGDMVSARSGVNALRQAKIKSDRLDYLHGMVAFEDKNYEFALQMFEGATQENANDLRSLYYAGTSALELGRLETAAHYLSRFNAKNPGFPPAMKLLAWLEVRTGNFTEAEYLLRQVLVQQPEDIFALNLLADVLAGENRAEESIEVLRSIVDLNPESVAARSRLGQGMLRVGMADEGLGELQAAQDLDPDRQDTAAAIIFSLLNQNKLDEALAAAQKLTAENPESAYTAATLGTVYLQRRELNEAESAFQRTLELDENNLTALSGLGAIAAQGGRTDEAKVFYRRTLEHHPSNLTTSLNLAYLCALDGSTDEMIQVLSDAIELHPNALLPRLSLARYHDGQGEFEQVIELLEPVRAYSGDNYEYLKMLSEAQYRTGNFRDARQSLKLMTQYAPRRADIRYMYAVTLRRTGDAQGAREEIAAVLDLEPDHIGARHQEIELVMLEENFTLARTRLEDLQILVGKNDPSALKLEATLSTVSGDQQGAVSAYQRIFDNEETNYNLLSLETAMWNAGDRDSAVTLLLDWLRKVPNDQLSKFRLASRYSAMGRDNDAAALLQPMLAENPDSPTLLNNLAWSLRDSDRRQAQKYAEQALELNPESLEAKGTLAVVLGDDDRERALRLIREAQRGDPDNPSFRYQNAIILADIGRDEEAIVALRKLLREYPDFEQTSEAKALLIQLDR